mgnify:CR=1 FL=1
MTNITKKQLEAKAVELKRAYKRNWYKKNKEHCRAYARKWRRENPERVAEYNRQYWERQAMQQLKAVKENS